MKEYDLRLEAKKNAEFITPEKLRYFIASKVNKKNITSVKRLDEHKKQLTLF